MCTDAQKYKWLGIDIGNFRTEFNFMDAAFKLSSYLNTNYTVFSEMFCVVSKINKNLQVEDDGRFNTNLFPYSL